MTAELIGRRDFNNQEVKRDIGLTTREQLVEAKKLVSKRISMASVNVTVKIN